MPSVQGGYNFYELTGGKVAQKFWKLMKGRRLSLPTLFKMFVSSHVF